MREIRSYGSVRGWGREAPVYSESRYRPRSHISLSVASVLCGYLPIPTAYWWAGRWPSVCEVDVFRWDLAWRIAFAIDPGSDPDTDPDPIFLSLSVMWSSEKNGKTGDTGASFGPVGDCEKPTGGDTGDARRGAWGFIPVFSV